MIKECVLCHPELEPEQKIILSNDDCMFLQLKQSMEKGRPLEGSGIIVPKKHRVTPFDLTREEWDATYTLLHEVKGYLNRVYQPQGYNLGWNSGVTAGQHIFHAHLHVLPRYEDEPLAGKGIRFMFKSENNWRRR